MKTLLLLQLFVSLILATDPFQQNQGQGNVQQNQGQGNDPRPNWQQLVSQSQMDFAVRIYQLISSPTERPPPQICFSPLSVYITLSMVALGSHGKTRDEILSALALNSTEKDTVLHEGNKRIIEAINQQTRVSQFKLGNEVFIQKGAAFLPQFQDMMDLYYNASVQTINFKDPRAAEETINRIVKDKTDNEIQDIIRNLKSETSMLLLDYAIFQDMWKLGFPRQNTKEGKFVINFGRSVTVPMMNREGMFGTYKDTEMQCTVVELPYSGSTSLVIIVPKLGDLYRVQEKLSAQKIKKYIHSMKTSLLNLYLPKVIFNYGISLKHYMRVMGMESMFTEEANFFRFSKDQKLKVSDIYHQSYINMEERGTEAISVTDARLNNLNVNPVLWVDHPYIMLIYQKVTETILGIGQIMDPTWINPLDQGKGEM